MALFGVGLPCQRLGSRGGARERAMDASVWSVHVCEQPQEAKPTWSGPSSTRSRREPASGRKTGVAYLEFSAAAEAQAALGLDGEAMPLLLSLQLLVVLVGIPLHTAVQRFTGTAIGRGAGARAAELFTLPQPRPANIPSSAAPSPSPPSAQAPRCCSAPSKWCRATRQPPGWPPPGRCAPPTRRPAWCPCQCPCLQVGAQGAAPRRWVARQHWLGRRQRVQACHAGCRP